VNSSTIVSPASFKLIKDYVYPYAYGYSGYVEQCTFTFSLGPEQIPGTDWTTQKAIAAFEDEVRKEGHEMISLQVWEDTSPIWTTDYKVVATATSSPGLPWLSIIGLALIIIFVLWALTFVIKAITTLWYGPGDNGGNGISSIGSLLTSIFPLIMIMMVFMMIKPMMKGMAGASNAEKKPKEIK